MGKLFSQFRRNDATANLVFGDISLMYALRGAAPAFPDWRKTLISATRHGLKPLLFDQALLESSPDTVKCEMQESFAKNVPDNIANLKNLANIIGNLANASIPVILLKDLHLSLTVYPSPAHRKITHIDLLVKPEHINSAVTIIAEFGYEIPEIGDWIAWFKVNPDKQNIPPLLKRNHPPIRLHITLENLGRNAMDSIWEKSQTFKFNKINFLGLSTEDLLIHICKDAANHSFRQGLQPVYDIVLLIKKHERHIDWRLVFARAKIWQAEKPLFIGLWLANELFWVSAPDFILSPLRPTDFNEEVAKFTLATVLAGESTDMGAK